ncbi:exported hypothetical protein [Desulfamplus magnetovallimortis]|uniref:DUF4350 domain-containing protein n=1 Tax=Desulfamplus magnetovallimortis TaxID=1246637 RepID=A0A1W1HL92_9BACT|nr:hypothetical protein [Desulfamplus magnetovallimortis]SLM33118.1 exported hypothetical protein [Desulfamplus magnetovallimortis]
MKKLSLMICFSFILFSSTFVFGDENLPDFVVDNPHFEAGAGPVVAVDAAHNNEHTLEHKFGGFGKLAETDGFTVQPLTSTFSADSLAGVDILVSATAMDAVNAAITDPDNDGWVLAFDPATFVYPMSAYTDEEVAAVKEWVKNGGSLMLVTDHMPFPASQQKLAKAFGVIFENSFAFDSQFLLLLASGGQIGGNMGNLLKFYADPASASGSNGKLHSHDITNGLGYVTSFTGSGMHVISGVTYQPLMEMGDGVLMHFPYNHVTYSDLPQNQLSLPLGNGVLQGLTLSYGKGRVAIFSEAAMFSSVPSPMDPSIQNGVLHPEAEFNQDFALNTLFWLANTESSSGCVVLGDDFSFTLPNLKMSGLSFSARFTYAGGTAFKLDMNSVGAADTTAEAIEFGAILNIKCMNILGQGFTVILKSPTGNLMDWAVDLDEIVMN